MASKKINQTPSNADENNAGNSKYYQLLRRCATDSDICYNLQMIPNNDPYLQSIYKLNIRNEDHKDLIEALYEHHFLMNKQSYLMESAISANNPSPFADYIKDTQLGKFDIDFKHIPADGEDNNNPMRMYKPEHIFIILTAILNHLSTYIKLKDDMIIHVLEKKHPIIKETADNGKIKKDGFHIVFEDYLFPVAILNEVWKKLVEDPDIKKIIEEEIKPTNEIEEVFDRGVFNNKAWFLYGAQKPYNIPYYVSTSFEIIDDGDHFQIKRMKARFNPKHLMRSMSNYYAHKNVEIINDNYDKSSVFESAAHRPNLKKRVIANRADNNTVALMEKLIMIIGQKRCEEYSEWRKVGQAIYNVNYESIGLFHKFSKRTTAGNYSEKSCDEEWEKFKKDSYKYQAFDINYLERIAKEDSPHEYKRLHALEEYDSLRKIFSQLYIEMQLLNDNPKMQTMCLLELSKLLKKYIERFIQSFITVPQDKGKHIWFFYCAQEGIWKKDDGGSLIDAILISKLHENIKSFLKRITKDFNNLQQEIMKFKSANKAASKRGGTRGRDTDTETETETEADDDDNDGDSFQDSNLSLDKQKEINKMLEAKTQLNKIRGIVQEVLKIIGKKTHRNEMKDNMATQFQDRKFLEKINTKTHLFVCANGTLDLENCIFRKSAKDDYMTYKTNCNFVSLEEITQSAEHVEKYQCMQNILTKIFPNPEIKQYFISYYCRCLDGTVKRAKIAICCGTGANGKSVGFSLLGEVMGDYGTPVNPSIFTQKTKDPGAANPQLVVIDKKRYVICEEPNQGEKFEIGILKSLTGGAKITARPLFKDPITIEPVALFTMNCNEKPEIPSTDGGTLRRLLVIPFNSKFLEANDVEAYKINNPDYPNYYPADTRLQDPRFIKELAPYFLTILFERYKLLKQNDFNFPEPDAISIEKQAYIDTGSVFAGFVAAKIIKDKKGKCKIKDAFLAFKEWCQDMNYTTARYTSAPEFKRQIENLINHTNKSENHKEQTWMGYRLKTDDEVDSDIDAGDNNKNTDSKKNVQDNEDKNTKDNDKIFDS